MKSTAIGSLFVVALFFGQGLGTPSQAQHSANSHTQPARIELMVPAYFYPGSTDRYWSAMTQAAQRVPLTAILNPASGPGTRTDPNYQRVITDLQAAGGRLIGYVHTSYGARSISDVRADIDRYLALYPGIDGFFIDEMFSEAASSQLTYYGNVYGYIKGLGSYYWVVGNPGTQIARQYLDMPAADAVVNFEGTKRTYRSVEFSDWVYDEPTNEFAHLVYNARHAEAMRKIIRKAVQRNAGMVYVTNDKLDNPWDTLPRYWEEEVNCVEIMNQGADRC